VIYQAFRYEIDPNDRQRTHLAKHAGCARFAYNWGLARRQLVFKETGNSPNAIALHRELNAMKKTELRWMYEVSKSAPQEALRDLDRAYERFFAEIKTAKARGRKSKVGRPRLKKKGRSRDSFRLTGAIRVGQKWLKLPRLGKLRLKETTDKLRGRILGVSVSREVDRWFVSLRVEVNRPEPEVRSGAPVGIDLGLISFAVISDEAEPVRGPTALDRGLRKQRRLARCHSRRQKGSRNRKKSAQQLARHHRRVANIRRDFLHKLSTRLVKAKPVLVVEYLNVAGMLAHRSLARKIADSGWGEFRRQLEYKALWYGCRLHTAPLFYPSSKTCSACGAMKQELALSERVYSCDACGINIDRDRNAALNLARLVAVSSTETAKTPGGEAVRPAPRRRASMKQEPSCNVPSSQLRKSRGTVFESRENGRHLLKWLG
jgi:putative transposase